MLKAAWTLPLAVLLGTSSVRAQSEPAGLLSQESATTGVTDVAVEGFQAPVEAGEERQATDLTLSAGGLLATGNARSLALTSAGMFRLRREAHQLSVAASGNYGRAAIVPDEPSETTVSNTQARVRYDYFATRDFTVFMAASARRDRFQGLDLRLNFDPGVGYYVINNADSRLWGELGYDLQHDIRRDSALTEAALLGEELDKSETRHHGRAFVGYQNKVKESLVFSTGLEYLQGLSPFEDDDTGLINWRLNWDAAFTTLLSESLSFSTTISVKFDHNPLPGVVKTDTLTAVNLVYTL